MKLNSIGLTVAVFHWQCGHHDLTKVGWAGEGRGYNCDVTTCSTGSFSTEGGGNERVSWIDNCPRRFVFRWRGNEHSQPEWRFSRWLRNAVWHPARIRPAQVEVFPTRCWLSTSFVQHGIILNVQLFELNSTDSHFHTHWFRANSRVNRFLLTLK